MRVVRPGEVDALRAVCERWGLSAEVVGTLRAGGELTVRWGDRVLAKVPARALADEGPVYERPIERPKWLDRLREDDLSTAPLPGCRSTRPSWRCWARPTWPPNGGPSSSTTPWSRARPWPAGADAAVIRLEGTLRAVAGRLDGRQRTGAGQLDPYLGGAHAGCAESARNVASVGPAPGHADCLNSATRRTPR